MILPDTLKTLRHHNLELPENIIHHQTEPYLLRLKNPIPAEKEHLIPILQPAATGLPIPDPLPIPQLLPIIPILLKPYLVNRIPLRIIPIIPQRQQQQYVKNKKFRFNRKQFSVVIHF
jgi:hypothetical protein